MNKLLLVGLVLSLASAHSQTTFTLDQNNASARISDNGIFFAPGSGGEIGYEIPKGDGVAPTYSMGLWLAGEDLGGQLHAACHTFDGMYDMFPGPIADDYSSTYYTDNFSSSIWKVTKEQIETHQEFYTVIGYEPVDEIKNWPGNGDATEGVAEQLAPYVDVNGDMIYNPLDGDYPYIQGDAAVYVIMNDANGVHANTGSDPLNAEIHYMFYQYSTTDDLNNTTFMNVKVYNRGSLDYYNFHIGAYNDFDIGFYNDDFVGSDSLRNVVYGYNAIDTDPAYGGSPPAFGTQLLSHKMGSGMYYNNSGGPSGDPTNGAEFYNYLRAIWKNGQPLYYGGNGFDSGTSTLETNCMFTGDPAAGTGWTEAGAGNPPSDRRMMISAEAMTLGAGEYVCADFAFIYSGDGSTNLENAADIKNVADVIQDFYDNNIQPCHKITVGLDKEFTTEISLYPNPSNGNITIEAEGTYNLKVLSLGGHVIKNLGEFNDVFSDDLSLENGIYLLELSCDSGRIIRKIQVLK